LPTELYCEPFAGGNSGKVDAMRNHLTTKRMIPEVGGGGGVIRAERRGTSDGRWVQPSVELQKISISSGLMAVAELGLGSSGGGALGRDRGCIRWRRRTEQVRGEWI
jgi:hypothetical protein